MKHGERFIPVLFQQRVDIGEAILRKAHDKLAEFRIKLRFDPRHVLALRANARLYARDAFIDRQVKEVHRVAFREPPLQRPAEVPIDDPAVSSENFGKRRVKFLFGNGRSVRPVPEQIERIEREPRRVAQPPGEGTFP